MGEEDVGKQVGGVDASEQLGVGEACCPYSQLRRYVGKQDKAGERGRCSVSIQEGKARQVAAA